MAGVAAGISQEVILVLALGLPKLAGWNDFLSAGSAVDFFTKPLVADVLLGAIRNAINRSCAALWNAGSLRSLQDSYASLSRREREVMALIAAAG